MKYIEYNIIPILLVLLAVYMVVYDKPFWGWVLFIAMIMTVVPNGSDKKPNT